jgi:hypothetical protein
MKSLPESGSETVCYGFVAQGWQQDIRLIETMDCVVSGDSGSLDPFGLWWIVFVSCPSGSVEIQWCAVNLLTPVCKGTLV